MQPCCSGNIRDVYFSNETSKKEKLPFDRGDVEMDLDESVVYTCEGWDFPKYLTKSWLLDSWPCSCNKLIIGL